MQNKNCGQKFGGKGEEQYNNTTQVDTELEFDFY